VINRDFHNCYIFQYDSNLRAVIATFC